MSHIEQLEQVQDLLINEDFDGAAALLHQIMVEKARQAYEDLIEDEFGGDMKADFADEIEADHAEIEADETGEDEVSVEIEDEDKDEDEDEEELEDRIEDLETAIADLTAEFNALMGDEDVLGDEEAMDDDLMHGDLEEAAQLQDMVADLGMDKEGKYLGTGAKSEKTKVNTQSPYTKIAPHSTDGTPAEFGGGDEAGFKADKGKDHTPTSNIDVDHMEAKHGDQMGDGKFAGTGAKSKGAGKTNTKSTLGQSASPRGK